MRAFMDALGLQQVHYVGNRSAVSSASPCRALAGTVESLTICILPTDIRPQAGNLSGQAWQRSERTRHERITGWGRLLIEQKIISGKNPASH